MELPISAAVQPTGEHAALTLCSVCQYLAHAAEGVSKVRLFALADHELRIGIFCPFLPFNPHMDYVLVIVTSKLKPVL
jgi:hypothetical protein